MAGSAATQQWRRSRVLRGTLLVLAVLLAALLLAFDWNWLQGPIERSASAAAGRPFRIAGQLDVDLGSTIVIRATGLELENVTWSPSPDMARADLLRIEVPIWSLLRGERVLRRVDLVRPRVFLERNRAGDANWRFQGRERRKPGRAWRFRELLIHEGHLRLRDVPLNTDLELVVDSAAPTRASNALRLFAHGTGRYRNHSFKLDGNATSPADLALRGGQDYDVEIRARAGATRVRAWGEIPVPVDFGRLGMRMHLAGDDLEDLYYLLGLAMPSTPPYEIGGWLERDGRVVHVRELRGKLGDSDIAGDVTFDARAKKPVFTARLSSSALDLDDLAGLVGAPPGTGAGEAASPEQRALGRERAASPRVLPDHPYDLRKLRSLDADVQLRAQRVDAGKLPVETLAMHLKLRDAVLRLDPLDVRFAGGRIKGDIKLDARRDTIRSATNLALRDVDLQQVWPNMQPPNVGRINADIELAGDGNSVADMLATADGSVEAAMGRGRFSNLMLELAGLDFAEALKFLLSKDKTVPLRCAYGDFQVEDGVMKAQALVFDTTDTVVFGSGKVNLDDEAFSLELKPEPKDVSPLTLRGPLEVGGTFKDPSFSPKPKPLLARATVAAALFAVAPPAALLALIETGPGENVDCHGSDAKRDKAKQRKPDAASLHQAANDENG